jgi:hypothetical protein
MISWELQLMAILTKNRGIFLGKLKLQNFAGSYQRQQFSFSQNLISLTYSMVE